MEEKTMICIAPCVLALAMSTNLAAAGPNGQEPIKGGNQDTRGSHETPPPARPYIPSSGLTLELMNGLPLTRTPAPTYQVYYYQPYPAYGFNAAYNWQRPFGLGGYSPPRPVDYGWGGGLGWGWGLWGW